MALGQSFDCLNATDVTLKDVGESVHSHGQSIYCPGDIKVNMKDFGKIGHSFPHEPKPLPEPMRTYHLKDMPNQSFEP